VTRQPSNQGETVAETAERDAKLVQYLNEAYGKEKELETSLQAHIRMTTKAPYKKRLQQHLRETKDHGRKLERRIKALGGGGQTVQSVAAKAIATAKGPLHAIRGASEQEKMLKNAKTEYSEEHEEIATYTAIEVFAEKVGDRETASLARSIRREEERMAAFLERLIPQLTRSVVTESVPAAQRNGSPARRKGGSSRARSGARARGRGGTRRRSRSGSRAGGSRARSRTRS
jgi:ferritin-like metal-binding protein YciE